MEIITSTSSTPSTPTGGVRNTFLTVICILSFIGIGWGIVKGVWGYIKADYTATIASGAMKNAEDIVGQHPDAPGFVKQIMGSLIEDMNPDFLRKLAICTFISSLLTLLGAILMWNLKKAGFYIYILGIIVLVVAPVTIGKLVGAMGDSIMGFIGFVFIVMYAVNLNQMNKKA